MDVVEIPKPLKAIEFIMELAPEWHLNSTRLLREDLGNRKVPTTYGVRASTIGTIRPPGYLR